MIFQHISLSKKRFGRGICHTECKCVFAGYAIGVLKTKLKMIVLHLHYLLKQRLGCRSDLARINIVVYRAKQITDIDTYRKILQRHYTSSYIKLIKTARVP